jgi:hypothetical protein
MFCSYKDIFGKVNEGVHSYRVFDIAIVDFGLTILAGFIISRVFNYNIIVVLVLLFLLGIIMHRLFCVRTKVDQLLFK